MQLEDYFDFLAPDDIRIKGTRIGMEGVLYEYIHHAQTPEQIAQRLHTVTLKQVYATIIDRWLNGSSGSVLGAAYTHVPFVA